MKHIINNGSFLNRIKFKLFKSDIKISCLAITNRDTIFEGYNKVDKFTRFKSSIIGFGSYIGSDCSLSSTKIGKYCSIGQRVKLITGRHPVDQAISSHPAFYSKNQVISFTDKQLFQEDIYAEDKFSIVIGNDVWIGSDAKILQGITIGDGAIIACGAVVTSNVGPYEIVGGVPAKIIRKRFTDEQINALLSSKWWDWPVSTIQQHAAVFMEPKAFFASLERISK